MPICDERHLKMSETSQIKFENIRYPNSVEAADSSHSCSDASFPGRASRLS